VKIETNSQGFVSVKKIDIKIKVKNGNVKLDNLFGSDKVLGEVVNQTINQNFDILSKEIIPLIEKSLNRIFKRIGNKIVERFTHEQLFPV
jgi:Haemolymph juvenile hormone binding protein (JHBP)